MKLDFSQFHPLDHWPWQCDGLYGGWRHHLSIAWELRRKEQVLWPWYRMLCLFDWHRFMVGSQQDEHGEVWVHAECRQCHLGRMVTDEEYDQAKDFWSRFSSRRHPEAGAS